MQLRSCSPEQVYDAVTDYPRAPEIFENVAESVVAREVRPSCPLLPLCPLLFSGML